MAVYLALTLRPHACILYKFMCEIRTMYTTRVDARTKTMRMNETSIKLKDKSTRFTLCAATEYE